MPVKILTPATGICVSVDDVKSHLRIESTKEDYLLQSYIKAAQSYVENYCKRSLIPKTYVMKIDDFPSCGIIEVPFPPLSTSSTNISINYTNASGVYTSLSSTYYSIDYYSSPGRIILNKDLSWPETYNHYQDVTIQYVAGYPLDNTSTGGTTPDAIKQWIMMRVGQMYEHREPVITGAAFNPLQRTFVDGLLDEFVVIEVI